MNEELEVPNDERNFWNDVAKDASPDDVVDTPGLTGFEAYQKEWEKRQRQKDEEAKRKLAQLEEEFPSQDRILAITKMKAEDRLKKDLQELDEYELNSKNSIPPAKTLGLPVAETNNEVYQPQIFNWEEFVNQPSNDKSWIIEDILRPGWLAVLGGHGKQGKTTIAIHLLNCLSQGKQFINNTLAVPAIHLNFEMGEDDIRDLVRTISLDSPVRVNAKIINRIPSPLNLQWLESLLANEELPGVCVIDSFRAAFMLTGDSENQAGTVGIILRKLQAISRKTKWSIIVIHHFRKSGTGEALDLAGSGEWLSAPDVIYTWSCPKPKEPGTLIITGRVSPFDPLAIKLSRETIEFLGTVSENEAETERQLILDNLTNEWIKSKDLTEITKLPDSTVRRRLNELLDNFQVERMGQGKRNDPYLWKLKSLEVRE